MTKTKKAQSRMREKRISSHDNVRFKELRTYLDPKGIRKFGFCILSGRKLTIEFRPGKSELVQSIIATPEMDVSHLLVNQINTMTETELLRLDRKLFDELDLYGTKSPLLVLKTPSLPLWDANENPVGIELLCALGEPSNLGALLRTAAGLSANKVVLLKECVNPFHPKALRAAAGATFKLRLAHGPSIHDLAPGFASDLRSDLSTDSNARGKRQPPIYALDMRGEDLTSFQWPANVRLLLGQEGPGVPQEHRFQRLRIETSDQIESLNATVAASLAIFHYRLRHPRPTQRAYSKM